MVVSRQPPLHLDIGWWHPSWHLECRYRGLQYWLELLVGSAPQGVNIQPIMAVLSSRTSNATALLHELHPAAYHMRGEPSRIRFGFIADEMEEVLPEVTRHMGADLPSARAGIMYLDLLAVLASSMQELTEEMRTATLRLSQVETRIAERQRWKLRSASEALLTRRRDGP
ncbi:unnamed protein product [Effrenium voratum]|uniref:Peptidase S74 domain-containing protein n=1 Tax=Effrenium voratum TaxID=2562239 RepID=A0AA36INF5_9DINO|nr:unnamed protein product [Effrenium voratum]CAJ1440888.1 unnamed protein product [Effrenium voratum]